MFDNFELQNDESMIGYYLFTFIISMDLSIELRVF